VYGIILRLPISLVPFLFRKTTLTGMRYEVPAFAGMTTLLGEMEEIPAFAGIGVRSQLIRKIYKDKK